MQQPAGIPGTMYARSHQSRVLNMSECDTTYGSLVSSRGYRSVTVDGRRQYAHRVRYEEAYGPIPERLEIDHLCRNPGCSNVEHLEAVTHQENIQRGFAVREGYVRVKQTHCRNGHNYTDNVHIDTDGSRVCVTCNRERQRQSYARRKLQL